MVRRSLSAQGEFVNRVALESKILIAKKKIKTNSERDLINNKWS